MSIICQQCGYENPDGSEICEICAETLSSPKAPAAAPVKTAVQVPLPESRTQTNPLREYFVLCPESHTKTILPNGSVTSFFCEGCKLEHEIDNFLWNIESRDLQDAVPAEKEAPAPAGDQLWLEEVNSHFRIEIDKTGGTLGRYGTYGSDFFQSRNMLTVSGEHCAISYEYGNWVIRHVSKTNQTKYNDMILNANEPNLLEDGKILTLANTVSFLVRIG